MKKPRINIIAAIGKNLELGKQNRLIWHISEDLKRVKALTVGHPIIFGRKTFESIGHPLPERTNIVITRKKMCIEGCLTFDSFIKGLEAAKTLDNEEVFVLGGFQIYKEALPYADRLYLTCIESEDKKADTYFPEYTLFTKVISEEPHKDYSPPFTYVILERR